MRLLAFIIIAISLTLGAIAATTAYLPRLEAVAPVVTGGGTITLAAAAGRAAVPDDQGAPVVSPVVPTGTVLTPELIETLRAAGVQRVRVKEFSLARWPLAWLFGVSVVGLLAGAAMVRLDRRRRIALEGVEDGDESAVESPAGAIAAISAELAALQALLAQTADPPQRQHLAMERLGEVQATHIDAFLAARERLIGRYGLAGFARIMDRFSALERQINRAWSAAADGVLTESETCIAAARALVAEVEAVLHR